jgi:hypothetical protein
VFDIHEASLFMAVIQLLCKDAKIECHYSGHFLMLQMTLTKSYLIKCVATCEKPCEATDIYVSAIGENSKLELSSALQGIFFKVWV